jgi:hypothetical protein
MMANYPFDLYHDKKYTITWTEGEAIDLFGDAQKVAKPTTIKFALYADNTVGFTVDPITSPTGRKFADEAKARFISARTTKWWPSPHGMIMGFLNKGPQYVDKTQQLFMMWIAPQVPLVDPDFPFELKMFFFHTKDCFSGGSGDIDGTIGGIGQINGGGIGSGPNPT